MQTNKTCIILEQYLNYLSIIKGRSDNTIKEYRTDILMFFSFLADLKSLTYNKLDFSWADINFIKSISINDIYQFMAHCQDSLKELPGTRSRKIVSLRQFWKYLRTKANLITDNITEGLEAPRLPKHVPKYLSLEESVRLLIECKASPRDHCIITLFLNCALRLSELASLNVEQIGNDSITISGKGSKERKIFLTPAAKKAVFRWLQIRNNMQIKTDALFISRSHTKISTRGIQNIVKKYVKAAGLDDANISTHKLRHTAATLMYKYGKVDIRSLQQILGHESIATTEIYTHVDEQQLQSAVNSNPLALMFN